MNRIDFPDFDKNFSPLHQKKRDTHRQLLYAGGIPYLRQELCEELVGLGVELAVAAV